MATAKQVFAAGDNWTDMTARWALPILLGLARSGLTMTYRGLDQAIAEQHSREPAKLVRQYSFPLGKIGRLMNQLSGEWQEELPPLTVLIVNSGTGLPSSGVDDFINRFLAKHESEKLSPENRAAMVKLATENVHFYTRWHDVAAYFGVSIAEMDGTSAPTKIADKLYLPPPIAPQGGESQAHLQLKHFVAEHPELFTRFGQFGTGETEYQLMSGDEVDVLFENGSQTLAIEVKTAEAPDSELTRGIFQCVKYRAVLRAMQYAAGEVPNAQVVLVTPRRLPDVHAKASRRLQVPWQRVSA